MMPSMFSFVQFPWRFLMLSISFISIVSAKAIYLVYERIEFKNAVMITAGIFMYISPLLSVTANDPKITDDNFKKVDVIRDGDMEKII
jgi:hypothetical protein